MNRDDRGPSTTDLGRWLEAGKGDEAGGQPIGPDVRYPHHIAGR
jgi:hypothetical protein